VQAASAYCLHSFYHRLISPFSLMMADIQTEHAVLLRCCYCHPLLLLCGAPAAASAPAAVAVLNCLRNAFDRAIFGPRGSSLAPSEPCAPHVVRGPQVPAGR
jgi:hypothetical protein